MPITHGYNSVEVTFFINYWTYICYAIQRWVNFDILLFLDSNIGVFVVCFVCAYALSTLPFIAVSNRFSRCLNHCMFRSFQSLFESTSTVYNRVEHCSWIILYLKRFKGPLVLILATYRLILILTTVELQSLFIHNWIWSSPTLTKVKSTALFSHEYFHEIGPINWSV